jgi:translation initiation factor IF-3
MSRFPPRSWPPREPPHKRNGKIRAREVRVLDEEKKPLGVMSLSDALKLAQQKGLDLVEIAATAVPPVCRIVDYGKFRYEQAKNEKHSQKAGDKLKEIQLSAVIDPHDFQTKVSHAIDFLSSDIKVRVKLRFKGRQKAHKEFGFEVVNRFVQALAQYGHADSPPKMLGDRDLNVFLTPLPREKRAKVAGASSTPTSRVGKDSPSPSSDAPTAPDAGTGTLTP